MQHRLRRARNTTPKHIELMKKHGWFECFDVDIMDSEAPDVVWQIPNGKVIKENHLGRHIEDYASMLVLSHFKGHPMGGYGGALKQLSIGCASSAGKAWIHSGGKQLEQEGLWGNICEQDHSLKLWRTPLQASPSISRVKSPISTLCAISPSTATAAP